MSYSRPEGKTKSELEAELRAVFDEYPEYSSPDFSQARFDSMVEKFASDNFYKLHFIAKAYLRSS